MTEPIESQIAEWRRFVSKAPAVNGHDADELEGHLRDQIAGLTDAGLAEDEAFLVAVKRMGDVDSLAAEFAREHSGRLWKQLVIGRDAGKDGPRTSGFVEAVAFAAGAAVAIHIARIASGFPNDSSDWFPRNLGLLVLPFLIGYFARRRDLGRSGWLFAILPAAFFAVVVNLFPYEARSTTEILVALHLPIALWFAVAFAYMGGKMRSHEKRMDFVRFTGEWIIYYVLIALGGGLLLLLTGLILEPVGTDVAETVVEWVLPAGAAGAVIVAAWLVESKQQVVENMAPVLTAVFTPLFAVMLVVAAVSYILTGVAGDFDRELLGVFDALLVVVLGLVLYSISAHEPSQPAGAMDWIQLGAVASALVLDLMVLGSMIVRIGDLGFTPNRVVALGLNLILLANLAGAAWLSLGFVRGRTTFHRLERWQTAYLPAFAIWTTAVVVLLPPLFGFE